MLRSPFGGRRAAPRESKETHGSTGIRANRTRYQKPSLLRGLIFGSDGRAHFGGGD